jgi:hypothetical protein
MTYGIFRSKLRLRRKAGSRFATGDERDGIGDVADRLVALSGEGKRFGCQ